jgi:hypothetical protein
MAGIRSDVGPRRHALLREATPVAAERGTVVFEVASHMHFHLEQLRADTELTAALAAAASAQLGAPVAITYRAGAAADAESEPERAPNREDLVEAEDDGPDPTDTVLEMLGGEVVRDTSGD